MDTEEGADLTVAPCRQSVLEPRRVAALTANLSQSNTNMILGYLTVPLPSISGVPIFKTGIVLLVTNKGKEVLFPFNAGPSCLVGKAIMDQHDVLPLVTSSDPPMFWPNWGIHINNRVMHPGIALKMLEKLPLPWDVVFASQCVFQDLKDLFKGSLIQVCMCLFT